MRIALSILVVLCIGSGCTMLSIVEPAHKMAVENQQNLVHNNKIVLDQLIKVSRSHPEFEPEVDGPVLDDMVRTMVEQVAISTAYIALITGLLNDTIEVDDFVKILDKLPEIIEKGQDLWDEIQKLTTKEK